MWDLPPSAADLRQANRVRIAAFLHRAVRPVTRQELSESLSISLPTLGLHLEELAGEGLVDLSQCAGSTGGRPPQQVRLIADARFALGAELTSRRLRLTAVNLRGEELAADILPRPESAGELAETADAFLTRSGLEAGRLLGTGAAAAPALLQEGTYSGTEQLLERPFRLLDSAVTGGLAEGEKAFFYLSLGEEITGAAFFSPGAGQPVAAGHLCIRPGGLTCACGRHGCLESYCSSARLFRMAGVGAEEFFRRIDRRDRECLRLWERFQEDLALGISSLCGLFGLPVVLGGQLSQFLPGRLGRLEERMAVLEAGFGRPDSFTVCRRHGWGSAAGAALPLIRDFLAHL